VGVAPEDDDGEKAEGRDKGAKPPGANWGKRLEEKANEGKGSAPKAAAGSAVASRGTSATAPTSNPGTDPSDTGEPITPGTLDDLRYAATAKFPKGRAAKDWLKGLCGTDDPAALSEWEAQKALKALEGMAA
jgi:hypothetical protein